MRNIIVLLLFTFLANCGGVSNNSKNAVSQNVSNQSPAGPSPSAAVQTVNIISPDGVNLIGSFYAAPDPHSPGLLLLHQWLSDRHSYDEFAKRMQAKGFNILSIDGRGFGESTKRTDGSTVTAGRTDADVTAMLGDVDAAFDFLSKQANVDPTKIGIVGASYGSSLALLYGADHSKGLVIALLSPGLNYFGNMPTEPALQKLGSDCAIFMAAANDDPESAKAVKTLVGEWTGPEKIAQVVRDTGGHGTALLKVGVADDLEKFLKAYLLKN